MKYLLDTNTCIRYLKGQSPRLKAKIVACRDEDMGVCSVVKAELYFGAEKSHDPTKARAEQDAFLSRFVSLTFDDAAASIYGYVRAELTRSGRLIGPNDLLIACIALSSNVILVTNNTSEFARVPHLRVEDWL